tara:strand:+ start:414 stop:1439 length:1026 start_codon:yes stop_codon:yes gene_type:complete
MSQICAEYVWLDINNNFRSKTKVISLREKFKLSDLPIWNYDGSSTGQAKGDFSEIILVPVKVIKCPFRKGNNIIVLCDTQNVNGKKLTQNTRQNAVEIFNRDLNAIPWYGLEQEYFIIDPNSNKPLGYNNKSAAQGNYYCGLGSNNIFGRTIAEEHLRACLYSNLQISGINAEVAPGQWEYQIGPCVGIDAGDQMLLSRYLLERIAETHNYLISFHPKPLEGDWNGSGCHTNFSTINMREGTVDLNGKTGYQYILDAVTKLGNKHLEHMNIYGEDNNLRMSGLHETSDYNKFSYGVGNRGASIRIPTDTEKNQKGYLEDRRPSSNCDPYLVTSKIFDTIMS